MTINLMHLLYLGLGLFGLSYLFIGGFRSRVNHLVRTKLFGWMDSQTTPREKAKDDGEQAIKDQKAALAKAMKLMEEQEENVVSVSATATTSQKELDRRKTAVETAVTNYNDGKRFGMTNEQLDELALKVKAAKADVAEQEANLKLNQAAAKRAQASLKDATDKVEKFAKNILSNEQKLKLADVLNTQTELDKLTNSIDSLLSDAGKANAEVERILAEAEERQKLGKDTTAEELERRRREEEARKQREELDGKPAQS